MRDYGHENLTNLEHPTAFQSHDAAYANERRRMATEAGLGYFEKNHLDHNDKSGQWISKVLHHDHSAGDAFNVSSIEYFNFTDRPVTVTNSEGMDTIVRHSRREDFIGEEFLNHHGGQKWFVIRRTEKIDLTAFCYRANNRSDDLGTMNLLRGHHFLMRNYINPPVNTPYQVALLEAIRKEFNRGEISAESILVQSYMYVDARHFPEDNPTYILGPDVTLTLGKYLPVDSGDSDRLFEMQRTKGDSDHPSSPYAQRSAGRGVFSKEYRGTAGLTIRCRSDRSHNTENKVYWVTCGQIHGIPVLKTEGRCAEGLYLSYQSPDTGVVSERFIAIDDIAALNDIGVYLHLVEATGKSTEFKSKFISESDAQQRIQEQEERTKAATRAAAVEAEQKIEAAKAKAKAQEDALRTDKIKLISVVVGAVASTFVALLGVIKLLTPSKSSFSSFLNFS